MRKAVYFPYSHFFPSIDQRKIEGSGNGMTILRDPSSMSASLSKPKAIHTHVTDVLCTLLKNALFKKKITFKRKKPKTNMCFWNSELFNFLRSLSTDKDSSWDMGTRFLVPFQVDFLCKNPPFLNLSKRPKAASSIVFPYYQVSTYVMLAFSQHWRLRPLLSGSSNT